MWPMNAATSLPRKFSPSPRPTTSGLLRRAPTTTPGLSACTARRVNAPSSRCTTLRMAVGEVADPVVLAADELRGDLGVGLGEELDALGEQLLLQRVEVLDDAVVDQGEPVVVAAAVRVGVAVGGAAVGRPAGVPDAGARGGERVRLERRAEVLELAGALLGRDAVVGDQGDARRVVPAVLEPGQPLHHDLEGRVIHGPADVAHDSAHAGQPSWEPTAGWVAGGRRTVAPVTGACASLRSRSRDGIRNNGAGERHAGATHAADALRRPRPPGVVAPAREPPDEPGAERPRPAARPGRAARPQRGRGGLPAAVAAAALLRRGHPRAAARDERVPRGAPDPRAVRRRRGRLGGGRQVDDARASSRS